MCLTEKEFKALKSKVLRQLGFINKELLRKQPLDILVRRSGLTFEEIELVGYGYKEESNQMGRFKKVEFEDLPDTLKEKSQVENTLVNNGNQLFTNFDHRESEQLQDLLRDYNIIKEMVNRFKQNTSSTLTGNIIIELPFDEDKQTIKSFRLNGIIAKQWDEFCKEHKEFAVKDLASMALKEYIDKYK